RDNVTKIVGVHTLQFGFYGVVAQKNEQSSYGSIQGVLTFKSSSGVTTGNSFADLLMGKIASYQQANLAPKYYFRYHIVEPYFQDDWRISLFGTYREKLKQGYDFEPSVYNPANAPAIADGSTTTLGGVPIPEGAL